MDLTSAQWSLLSPLVAPANARKHPGRPYQDVRAVLHGIFWVLRAGARWADLPLRYPSHQTCHRRFREWLTDGTLFRCFQVLAADLHRTTDQGAITVDIQREPALVYPGHDGLLLATHGPRRSWKAHTALLLLCPLAQQALRQPPGDTAALDPSGDGETTDQRQPANGQSTRRRHL